jgi:glycosyltransferase involved in cell wall biosynthesis
MFKILILTHRFSPEVGGIETNSEILATAFTEFGAEVHVLTWTKHKAGDNFPFKVLRGPSLNTIFKEHKWADVVFENNPCLRLSWVNFFTGKPLVIALNTWVNRIKGNKGVRDKLKNLWFGRADAVIAVSEALRKKEWPKAVVIENPYNDKLFTILPGAKRTKAFIFLGRLVSDKGADQAVKAIDILSKRHVLDADRLQLTVTGDGPELKSLIKERERSNLYGAVHFTGVLKGKELVDCLNEHQFMLVPSAWEEPYGNVVLEGMACGCVPVASNGGGMPEAVGKAGFIFKRNDMEDMVNVIEGVLNDDSKVSRVRGNAAEHLREHTSRLVSKKYFDILQLAAGRNQ